MRCYGCNGAKMALITINQQIKLYIDRQSVFIAIYAMSWYNYTMVGYMSAARPVCRAKSLLARILFGKNIKMGKMKKHLLPMEK